MEYTLIERMMRGKMKAFYDKRWWKSEVMGRRDLNVKNHWKTLNPHSYKITKPTVICLGGNATTNALEANGFCKQAENMLSLIKRSMTDAISDRVDIIGFGYATEKPEDKIGQLSLGFVDEFVENVLMPLFTKDGARVSLNEAKKNMSKVSFFTYCQGQREANKIMDSLDIALKNMGYEDYEIEDINSACMNVAFAPLDSRVNYMPTVRVLSIRDDMVGRDIYQILTPSEMASLDGVTVRVDDAGYIYGVPRKLALSGSINVISSQLLNATERVIDEHLAGILARDQNWNIKEFANNNGDLVISNNADCVSQIMSYALASAVENGEKNMHSRSYIPNDFYSTLPSEIDSIVSSFSKPSLQAFGTKRREEREIGYNGERWKKARNWSENYFTFSKPQSVIFAELKEAKSFLQVASIFEANNYNYMDELMPAIRLPLSDDQKCLLQTGAKYRQENRLKRRWQCEPDAVINSSLSSAKSFEEIKTILSCFDYRNAQIFASVLLSRTDNKYPITKAEIEKILKPLKKEFDSRPEKIGENEYFRLISNELSSVSGENAFERVAEIFEKYDYYAVLDILPTLQDVLSKEQRDNIMFMRRAKIVGVESRESEINILKFDEMVDLLNSAESYEDAISRYSKYGFCGAKYVLPEVLVLTDEEKDKIMEMERSEREI